MGHGELEETAQPCGAGGTEQEAVLIRNSCTGPG